MLYFMHIYILYSDAVDSIEECFFDGEPASYGCPPVLLPEDNSFILLVWDGIGFDCSNSNDLQNNLITLSNPAYPTCQPEHNMCGNYSATMTCINDQPNTYLSTLSFIAHRDTMNGGIIHCGLFRGPVYQNFSVRIGGKLDV